MPIPTGGAWPPPAYGLAYAAYRDWDAWYTGDPDRLRTVYLNRTVAGQSLPPSQRVRAGQYAGGIVGYLSRWLWGNPPTPGQRDGRLHVPLPADLAATAANLLFAEPPTLTSENVTVQARLELLQEDGLNTTLLHAAEADSAFGDVYLRPVIDRDVYPDRAFLGTVHADGALPVIRWGRLVEVTFWSELENDGQRVIRLLEHHDVVTGADGSRAGRIEYRVYEGTPTQLGRAISLADHAGSTHLADLVDETGAQATGLDRLDVVRIANCGPQRRWRTEPGLKYLGRSDFDGNEQIFDRIDETWTSWMRDIRLARARIMIPDYMLQSNGPGQGATWDADREVYAAINALPVTGNATGQGITLSQFAIRHAEHKATADALTEVAMRHAGLSAQTLGEEGDVAVTATEVQARERQSFTTRGNRIQGSWRAGVADAVELLLAVERAQLNGKAEPQRPNVEFGDSVSEAPETVARTVQLLDAANAISIETKVRMVHPDWDDEQVRDEVNRIREDEPTPVDVGSSLGALAGNQPNGGNEGEGQPGEE
ncbi:phage capsid protein [Micromonospora sp. KC606]|uniref:phage capsid protein n=1 Tax=Micromonospora sp. KC606 TaxID=2530379 RepID=UPI00105141D5|nr:phage capsid protein [Micromonospora sp. KC606]TDC81897.1 phage capsid protein [Micromonospora sp. KC606]